MSDEPIYSVLNGKEECMTSCQFEWYAGGIPNDGECPPSDLQNGRGYVNLGPCCCYDCYVDGVYQGQNDQGQFIWEYGGGC